MSQDDLPRTDDANSRFEGQKPESDAQDGGAVTPVGIADGIADIQATLAQLEHQIAAYRRRLAEIEVPADPEPIEEDQIAVPLVRVNAEELGDVSEAIASDIAAFYAEQVANRKVDGETVAQAEVATEAVVEKGATIDAEFEEEPVAKPTFREGLGTVSDEAESVEEVSEVSNTDTEELAVPSVDLPKLFAELESQLEMGLHSNASVAIYIDGREYLQYVSSEFGSGIAPEPQPLFWALSSGNAMASAVIWRLLDAGVLGIDAPVAEYWSEFAQRGKTKVTLRHVLTHTAGLPSDFGRTDVDWSDWGRMSDILASMDLEYEPGKVVHYHAITFGVLIAEIASRVSGISFETLFDREVKYPLGLVDTCFSIGAGEKATRNRVQKLVTPNDHHDREIHVKMDWLLDNQVVSPGATCITTASDLAQLYATVCNGGLARDGRAWLSEDAAANVFDTHASTYNIESMTKDRVGQGVWLWDEQPNRAGQPEGSTTFGHGKKGPSIVWGDPECGIAVSVMTDTMHEEELNDKRLNRISAAARWDLGLPIGSVAKL